MKVIFLYENNSPAAGMQTPGSDHDDDHDVYDDDDGDGDDDDDYDDHDDVEDEEKKDFDDKHKMRKSFLHTSHLKLLMKKSS